MANETAGTRGLSVQSPQSAFKRARVNIPGYGEAIYQPLYDYQTLAATAVAQQRFFQVPQGQSGKVLADTNMELAGQIPKGQAFLITGIQVEILPGVAINGTTASKFADDIYTVSKGGALKLTIGSKDFVVQGNLAKFPPVNRLALDSATTVATDRYSYAVVAGREFSVADLLLESNQNFNVTLLDLAALPSASPGRIGVTLNGFLYRNAQ